MTGTLEEPATQEKKGGMYEIQPGRSHPLGATPDAQGVNFVLFSEHATAVELLLFARADDLEPMQTIRLDPQQHRTFHFWHAYIPGLPVGTHYAYRLSGPQGLHNEGERFDAQKVLIDPYSRGNYTGLWQRAKAVGDGDNLPTSMRSTVIDYAHYDWEGDQPLNRPLNESVIYEMHVGGFTRSPSSNCQHPGTFHAVMEKIPYLQALGITAVELMPVFAFDEDGVNRTNPQNGAPLEDYWGYNPVSHFAPHQAYCVSPQTGSHINDFRDMVKALHKAGIEVILDVVFNHTSEGGEGGPTINFRGIDNRVYYLLDPRDRANYLNYAGTGNTFDCNHPIVDKLIADCLRWWVTEMHVDGFRFDEGSILSLDVNGNPMEYPPVIWNITLSEMLAETKVIAEPWDAAGLYQVGSFPGYRWSEWNGQYRDTIRRFVKGDPGIISAVASRIAGSSDIYQSSGRLPTNGINFITCHDGFTLNDLVSYDQKHNEANGEDNHDGADNNLSWNCGVEGFTDNSQIIGLRQRQMKNFLAILLLSQGVPMLSMGDEVQRTQQGNNNVYCQNTPLSWFDWAQVEQHAGQLRFCQRMIAFRRNHPNLQRAQFLTGQPDATGKPDIAWHGCKLNEPGWNDAHSRVLAFTLWSQNRDQDLHIMLNMDAHNLDFAVPADRQWYVAVDTALTAPADIAEPGQEHRFNDQTYHVESHSVVVLLAK
ncbi:MAG TPA: glycogen debranching protein GlgX [Ktedonobacteraceae bacterium]|nr:glycogen debranching protein GlgX [Ktedonobacteraceae bacterium]